MKKFGISVYPSLFKFQESWEYIQLAYKCGFLKIFTNFLEINFIDQKSLKQYSKLFLNAQKLGMEIIFDINTEILKKLELSANEIINFFQQLGANGLRFDESKNGELESQISHNQQNFIVEINASSQFEKILTTIKQKGNIKNIKACHNFYPQKFSGLSIQLFDENNYKLQKDNIPIGAFIQTQNSSARGPWKLNEGLITLEKHREKPPIFSAAEFMANSKISEIIFANQPACKKEMITIKNLDWDALNFFVELSKTISPIEKEILLENNEDYEVRQDLSDYLVRFSFSRKKYNHIAIPVQLTQEKSIEKGDILIVNSEYGRYNGELQIALKEMPKTNKKNIIGKVLNLELLDYVKPLKKVKFLKYEKN